MSFGGLPQDADSIDIAGEGWPDLSTGEFRARRRIPAVYEEAVLADALRRSAWEVQEQLTSLLDEEGAVPALSERQRAVYLAAVYSRAHGDLLGYFATVDRREAGDSLAKDDPEQRQGLLAESNRCIRLILGRGRAGVVLV